MRKFEEIHETKAQKMNKEANCMLILSFFALKLEYNKQLKCGKLCRSLFKNGYVLEFAQKD